MIYFIQCGDEKGPIKIGFAIDPEKRLYRLQCANPCELTLLKAIHSDVGDEGRLHAQFGHLRIRGEWFEPGDDLWAYIKEAIPARMPEGTAGSTVVAGGPAGIAGDVKVIESSCWLGNRLISKTDGEGQNIDDPPGVMTETTDGELTAIEAARLAGTTRKYIQGLIRSGTVKASKVGGRWAVDHASLEGWLGGRKRRRRGVAKPAVVAARSTVVAAGGAVLVAKPAVIAATAAVLVAKPAVRKAKPAVIVAPAAVVAAGPGITRPRTGNNLSLVAWYTGLPRGLFYWEGKKTDDRGGRRATHFTCGPCAWDVDETGAVHRTAGASGPRE